MDDIKRFRKELLAKVTRMEVLEEEMGIQINHLSLITEPNSEYIDVNFEVIALSGNTISQDLKVNFAFYDDEGTITSKSSIWIESNKFRGFSVESCTCNIYTEACNIARILIYPSEP